MTIQTVETEVHDLISDTVARLTENREPYVLMPAALVPETQGILNGMADAGYRVHTMAVLPMLKPVSSVLQQSQQAVPLAAFLFEKLKPGE